MATIDADTHFVESLRTWEYMEGDDKKLRPVILDPFGDPKKQAWYIDGQVRGNKVPALELKEQQAFDDTVDRTTLASEEAKQGADLETRLRQMDEYGVDFQVVFPTIFLMQVAERPATEVAICWAYNRWAADICDRSEGRLKYAATLSMLSIPDALDQMRFSKQHGAPSIFFRPIEVNRLPTDPYFYPIYEEAARLDMSIGMHIGNAAGWLANILQQGNIVRNFWSIKACMAGAVHALLNSDIHERFPTLRFGFLEATSAWLPYVLREWYSRLEEQGKPRPENPLVERNMWVALQSNDDIPYLLKEVGEDCFVMGTDYGHNDTQAELDAFLRLRDGETITEEQYRKITVDNPKALYAL
jgi:predicted TIM-barrel fold metal-dependent hydrolase